MTGGSDSALGDARDRPQRSSQPRGEGSPRSYRCCRWSVSWTRRWHGSPDWSSDWPCSKRAGEEPPDNSSLPPSRGARVRSSPQPATSVPARAARPPPRRRNRQPNPDRVVDARLEVCPHCPAVFPAEQQTPQEADHGIELPPIKPDVTQVRLFARQVRLLRARATAASPSGLSRLAVRPSIAALVGIPALRPRHRTGAAGGRPNGRVVLFRSLSGPSATCGPCA